MHSVTALFWYSNRQHRSANIENLYLEQKREADM